MSLRSDREQSRYESELFGYPHPDDLGAVVNASIDASIAEMKERARNNARKAAP